MMKAVNVSCVLAVLAVLTFAQPHCNETNSLQECLLHSYNKYMRPGSSNGTITFVNLSMNLLSIDDLDLKRQTITAGMYLVLSWRDERLKWNVSSDLVWINTELVKLWRPDLILASISESLMSLNFEDSLARISPDGIVSIFPFFKVTLGTEVDITKFPFDSQEISFLFEDWSFSNKQVMFSIDEKYDPFQTLTTSGEWEVEGFNVLQWNISYSSGYYHRAGYSINIKRQPLYYIMNVFGPVVVVSLLNTLCFLLPVSSGDRVTLSVSIFLLLTVLQISVADSLPKTSRGVSLCVAYIGSHMLGSTFTIIMVVFIIYIDNKGSTCNGFCDSSCQLQRDINDSLNFDEEDKTETDNIEKLVEILKRLKFSTKCSRLDKSGWKWKVLSNRLNLFCLSISCLWNIVLLIVLVGYGYS